MQVKIKSMQRIIILFSLVPLKSKIMSFGKSTDKSAVYSRPLLVGLAKQTDRQYIYIWNTSYNC